MTDPSYSTDNARRSDEPPSPTRTLLVNMVQAAEILALSRSSMYQLISTEQLVPIRIGRSVRFTIDQLERFVAERAADAKGSDTSPP